MPQTLYGPCGLWRPLADSQEFLLEGRAWKHNPVSPLSKLKVAELRTELSKRGIETAGKRSLGSRKTYRQPPERNFQLSNPHTEQPTSFP